MTPRDRGIPELADDEASCICIPASCVDPLPLTALFGREAPLEVDVGCGKGRFLVARAAQFPDHNFLGIDRQLMRLRKVDRKLHEAGIRNVRLLRLEAGYSVRYLLPPESVDTFYIFFPDPWPKRRHHTRRLLQQEFLNHLLGALRPGGRIHLATDHQDYFRSALALMSANSGLDPIETFTPSEEERTEFELLFRSQELPIGRCSFRKSASR